MVWCAACGGYLLYVGEVTNLHELITAAVLATGASVWASGIHRCGRRRFALSLAHTGEWAKAVGALGPAIAKTFLVFARAALFERSQGRLLEIPFDRGAEDSPRDAARRASALLIASLGPDNFVVRAKPEHDCVLMHAILPGNASRDPRWLNS
ncbi:MAG: hypothetical protein ACREP2_00350 [Rhodanobacteraceae bacterium]